MLMPKLFYQAGIVSGSLQIIVFGLLAYISGSMLCETGKVTNSRTYYEVVSKIFPRYGFIPNIIFFILLIGNIICYHSFVLKNLAPLLNYIFDLRLQIDSHEYTVFALCLTVIEHLIILPFLFSRKLTIVKRLTAFCSAAIFIGVGVIIAVYFSPGYFDMPKKSIEWDLVEYFRFEGMYVSIGYYLLSFCFHLSVIDIAEEISPSSSASTDIIIFSNCLVAALVYIFVSFTGYFSIFTEDGLSSMTNYVTFIIIDLGKTSQLLYASDFFVIFSVVFANILNYVPMIKYLNAQFNKKPVFFSVRDMNINVDGEVDSLAEFNFTFAGEMAQYKQRNRVIVGISFMFIFLLNMILVALNVRLDVIFDFVGALCGPPVLLIIPGLLYLKMLKSDKSNCAGKTDYILPSFMIVIGTAVFAFCLFGFFRI
jgi:amino acid permease